MEHSGDVYELASTLCKYDLRKSDLFLLGLDKVRPVSGGVSLQS